MPTVLVANDDGIDSYFLAMLVAGLKPHFDVFVAVPAEEQSWVSRAMTRRGHVTVKTDDRFGCPAWAITGTPTDCVNLALGGLLDSQPDVVVSGINLGFNVTLPLILNSGTLGAAMEGAFWGLPAVALSLQLPPGQFDEISEARGKIPGGVTDALTAAVSIAVPLIQARVGETSDGPVIHNINFPHGVQPDAPVKRTRPARVHLGQLLRPYEDGYRFAFPEDRRVVFDPEDSDLRCLRAGHVSHTILDLSVLGT